MKYEILESTSKEELVELVNDNIGSRGWIVCGGAMIDEGMFYQTIRHPSDSDPKPITGESEGKSQLQSKLNDLAELVGDLKQAI